MARSMSITSIFDIYDQEVAYYTQFLPAIDSEAAGIVSQQEGRLSLALEQYQKALDIRKKCEPNTAEICRLHRRKAQIHQKLNNLKGVIYHLKGELAVARLICPVSKHVAELHGLLATRYNHLKDEDYDIALVIDHLEQRLNIQQQLPPGSENIAATHRILAESYEILGENLAGQEGQEEALNKAAGHKMDLMLIEALIKLSSKPLPTERAPSPR